MSYQREYERRIRVGIVGAGSHCYRNILPVMNFLPVEIVAICDVNETPVKLTARQYGASWYTSTAEMYRKELLDAVFIVVGASLHPSLVIEALDNGLDVWVEKPIAVRASQVKEIIEHRGDRIVTVGLKKAFSPACQKVKSFVNDSNLGDLESMLAVYPLSIEENGEDLLEAKAMPNWLRNGVHPISLMMEVGGEVDSVQTITNNKGFGDVILRFKSDVVGTLHLASGPSPDFEAYDFFAKGWRARIENARVTLDRGIPFDYRRTVDYTSGGYDSGRIVWEPGDCVATLENKALFVQGFFNETKYFCDCVLNRTPSTMGSLEMAYDIMRVYEAAYLSNGSVIPLEVIK